LTNSHKALYNHNTPPQHTETIEYDEIERETTTTPGVVKRKLGRPRKDEISGSKVTGKRSATDAELDDNNSAQTSKRGGSVSGTSAQSKGTVVTNKGKATVSSASSSSSSSSRAGAVTGDNELSKNKAHYPEIPFKYASSGGKSSKSHTEILSAVVADICKAEKVGLEKFFKTNPGPGRDEILATLKIVLESLPDEISEKVPADAEFEPEFVKGERGEVEVLSTVLSTLREQSAKLTAYEQNIAELGNEYGIWLTSEQVPKGNGGASSKRALANNTVRVLLFLFVNLCCKRFYTCLLTQNLALLIFLSTGKH